MSLRIKILAGLALIVLLAILATQAFQNKKEQERQIETYYTPGIALYEKGDYPAAEKDFHDLSGDSDQPSLDAESHYRLGLCFLQEGKMSLANEAFKMAISEGRAQEPGTPDAPCVGEARAALAWLDANPNWHPSLRSRGPSQGPPREFSPSEG